MIDYIDNLLTKQSKLSVKFEGLLAFYPPGFMLSKLLEKSLKIINAYTFD